MIALRLRFTLFALAWLLSASLQAAGTGANSPTNLLSAVSIAPMLGSTNMGQAFLALLRQPDTFNTAIRGVTNLLLQSEHTNALLGFINDLHLVPKIFHARGSEDNSVLGFEYDFKKALANRVLLESSLHPVGLSFNLEARGNVAFEADKNPDNLLESSASLHLFQGLGGIRPTVRKNDRNYLQALDEAQMAAGKIPPGPRWQDDPRYLKSAEMVSDVIIPQFFYDLRAHGTLEADQQFNDKQFAYGAQLGIVLRDWRDSSWVSWANLPDYPFALIRMVLDQEDFQPSGRAIPVVLGGLDLVDASDNGTRLAVDPADDHYARWRLEVAFKTRVLRTTQKDLWFSASYRFFQELGASQAIRDARLDRQNYFVMKLDLPYHFNVSYSTGKLPLDAQSDKVYGLGWALNF